MCPACALPRGICGDDSVPCASANAWCGLCQRSVRRLRLGIARECTASGYFERPGEPERMRLVFEREALAVKVSALPMFPDRRVGSASASGLNRFTPSAGGVTASATIDA